MLAKRFHEHGDVAAAHRLVTSHLRLVAKIAGQYRGYGLPSSELMAEGNIGLMQAVRKFDPERGFRLATYAMWWIRPPFRNMSALLVAGENRLERRAEKIILRPAQAQKPHAQRRSIIQAAC